MKKREKITIILIGASYFGLRFYKCHIKLINEWNDFRNPRSKLIALGRDVKRIRRYNMSLVYLKSIKPILKNPHREDIHLYFNLVPDYCRGADGYAYKDSKGNWFYKVP